MTNFVQIPNLPVGIALNGTEQFEAVQSGVSVQLTAAQIAAYVQSQFAGVTTFSAGATGLTPSTPMTGPIVLGGTLNPTHGGTGLAAYTAGDLLYASATNTLARLPIGSNGQILSLVAGLPAWVNDSSVSVSSFSGGTTGLTPSSPTAGAIVLAGTLVAANGGTGQSSYAIGDLLYASGATALSKLADVATGNALISGGVATAPSWGKIGLTTHVSGVLPPANGGTGVANASTVTLGGNFAMAGAFTFAGTLTGNTAVTFPTSGTLATTAGIAAALPSATASQLYVGSGAAGAAAVASTLPTAAFPALTGDVTTAGGALATTLATVNANVGSFGSSTAIPSFTVNGKGLITAAATSAVIAPAGTLTGTTLAANVVSSSLTSLGTIATGVWQGTLIGSTYGGTGVNNGASTLTLGGSLTTSGAFASTFTMTGITNVTFPTSGTLATVGGTASSVSNVDGTLTISPTTGAVVASLALGHANTWSGQQTFVAPILGTPASGTLTNATGLPISTGVSGLGTGVATALAVNVGSAGAFVTFNGALGTPSSGVATNLTGTAAGLTAGSVTTNANLTGVITSVGNATSIASQTGTGTKFVVATSPTLVTPVLGVATATAILIGSGATGATGLGVVGTSVFAGAASGNATGSINLRGGFSNSTGLVLTANSAIDAATIIQTQGSGTLGIGGGNAVGLQFSGTNTATFTSWVKPLVTVVASLPSAATAGAGAMAFVTDANTTVILGLGLTVVGGGANKVPVYSDGTNWIVG